jgi:hypothetical protein
LESNFNSNKKSKRNKNQRKEAKRLNRNNNKMKMLKRKFSSIKMISLLGNNANKRLVNIYKKLPLKRIKKIKRNKRKIKDKRLCSLIMKQMNS